MRSIAGKAIRLKECNRSTDKPFFVGIKCLWLFLIIGCLLSFPFQASAVPPKVKPQDSQASKTTAVDSANSANLNGILDKEGRTVTYSERFQRIGRGALGLGLLILLAFLLSLKKSRIDWKLVITSLLLQIVFATLVLKVPLAKDILNAISSFFVTLLDFSEAGSEFLLGDLANKYVAFQILPTIIFFSALTSLFYYLNLLQKLVYAFAWVMKKTMRLSGAESLAAAANVFIGQTEAPLVVKPYINKMTRSEVMALMTGGMATIAGGVLAAYISFLGGENEAAQQLFARHLLTASIMSAPASLLIAKIMVPETQDTSKELLISGESEGANLLDAIAHGTTQGLKLAVNVGAMVLVFLALMAFLNHIFEHWIGEVLGINQGIEQMSGGRFSGLTIQFLLGYLFAPLAWMIGVPSQDLLLVGQLLGEKTAVNEFIAYKSLAAMKTEGSLSPKALIIATYALCGFANFGSIGIQIGGIGAIAPNQRPTLSALALYSLIAGTIACMMTGCIAGMLV